MFKKITHSLISKVLKYPKLVISLTTFLSILLLSGIEFIQQDEDLKQLLPHDMPSIVTFNEIEDEFGNFEFMYLAIGNIGESVFKPEVFNIAWDLSNYIEQLDECDEVVSISNSTRLYFDDIDSSMVISDLVPKKNLTQKEIDEIKEYLDENRVVKDRLVSKNNDYLNFLIRPANSHIYTALADSIQKISDRYIDNDHSYKYETHMGGQSYFAGIIPGIITKEVKVLILSGFLIMIFILLINLKNIYAVSLIVITTILSLLSMLGFMGWVYYFTYSKSFYFTLNNASMPILLLTIANSDGVHIISRFFKELRHSKDIIISITNTCKDLCMPIILTSVTTMLAFLALLISPIKGMNGYGITIAFGIFWACLLSLTFLPAMISLIKWNPNSKSITKPSLIELYISKFSILVKNNPKRILSIGGSIVAIATIGLFFVKVEVNMVEMFKKGTVIRDSATFLDENMTGNLNILIKTRSKSGQNGLNNPQNLKDLEKLQIYLDSIDEVTSTISITEVVKEMHKTIMDGNDEYRTIPESRAKINNLFFLYYMNKDADLSSLINDENDVAIITSLLETFPTTKMDEYRYNIKEFIDNEILSTNDDLEFEISGMMAFFSDFIKLVIESTALSIAASIILIFIVSSIFFKSWIFGILSIITLFSAIVMNYGFMGIFGIELTHITIVLSSIIIGVGVDFSIHYISEYKKLKINKANNKTIKTIEKVGHPIILDACSNMGFAALLFSTIIPLSAIGGLMIFAMVACSMGTLTILASSIEIFKHKIY
jgi:predicted RND superfamily exporter protein